MPKSNRRKQLNPLQRNRIMRKTAIIMVSILTIILIVGLSFWIYIRVPNRDFPVRLNNIPQETIWRGGIDEGFWFQLVGIDTIEETYRIRIYNDYNGELVIDADFENNHHCDTKYPLNKDIFQYISYFEMDKIEMKDDCKLIIVKPTYGGTYWEEILKGDND